MSFDPESFKNIKYFLIFLMAGLRCTKTVAAQHASKYFSTIHLETKEKERGNVV